MLLFKAAIKFILTEPYQLRSNLMAGRCICALWCPTLCGWDLVVSRARRLQLAYGQCV